MHQADEAGLRLCALLSSLVASTQGLTGSKGPGLSQPAAWGHKIGVTATSLQDIWKRTAWIFVWGRWESQSVQESGAKEGYDSGPSSPWVFVGGGRCQETINHPRKALTVRPEALCCFSTNRLLFMIMFGSRSRSEFNCQTLQTSPWLHSEDRWCPSPFMWSNVLGQSVHHGMANDSDEAVEEVVSVFKCAWRQEKTNLEGHLKAHEICKYFV